MQSDDIFTYFDDFEFITIRNELVNPWWNKWVEKSTWDIILIINDDIIIQEDVWRRLSELNKWYVYCPFFTRKNIFNKIHDNNWDNIVWFCFWIHKKDWQPIPDDLLLWYWDNYIYEYMWRKIQWGWYIHHFESSTLLSPEHKEKCDKIIAQDKHNWINIKKWIKN
jgi:hypothetical protein